MVRPTQLRKVARAATLLAHAALLVPHGAAAQSCDADLPDGRKLESENYVLAYRTAPAPVPMGKHFTLEIAVCPRAGAEVPARLDIDAHMPEHRHGMNYKVIVKPLGPGRYQAEGLMFHMPGRWELLFDVHSGGQTVRLTDGIILR
jgi:hypothetical protein